MGIKGIYKEIGPGERISLCKLAVDTLEQTGRPLRLAIDFSIWQFQVQAARGGSNPAIRTLFYRLVRLLSLAIHPLFVFDGANKPAFKRNKRSYSSGRSDMVATAMAKRLIRLFGFATHDAPGEAEAECALLEQQGVVDAVLSEDVDAIMFGCRKMLRNWSAEGTKGAKTPTHVSLYDARAVAAGASGLDREGMVLVALMSGGDYLPEGVPGCGVKVACEAARAGFGRDLCRLKRADKDGLAAWKERLLHELRTNESKFFRTKHKAMEIPESFPSMEILRYYTHPVVSKEPTIEKLKREFPPQPGVDVAGLRDFARETFDWDFRDGAVKLIRVLAPSLLVQRLLERYVSGKHHYDDLDLKQKEESALVQAISSRRAHFSTDATPELRMSFIPADIVKLNLGAEPVEDVEAFGRSGIALNSDEETDEDAEDLGGEQSKGLRSKKLFDPLQPDLVWIPETVAKLGVPLTVEDWEAKQRLKKQKAAAKATRQPRTKRTDMPVGALDKYLKITKPVTAGSVKDSALLAPQLSLLHPSTQRSAASAPSGRSKQTKKTSSTAPPPTKPTSSINPWTLASLQVSPRVIRCLAPCSSPPQRKPKASQEPILVSSSPVVPVSPPVARPGLIYGETMPTRAKRLSSPLPPDTESPAPLSDSFMSPSKQRIPAEQKPQLQRKARPFKRAKSGAGDNIGTTSTQKSIKSFGRVTKNASSSRTKKAGNPATQPIEILSDDDDDDFPLPLPLPKQPPASTPSIFGRTVPAPPGGNLNIDINDDDPFASPPRLRRHAVSPPPPPTTAVEAPARQSETARTDHQPETRDDHGSPSDDLAAKSTKIALTVIAKPAATAKTSKTTKIYIPRTSLSGLGYFTEVEVPRDEAEAVLAAHNRDGGENNVSIPGGGQKAPEKGLRSRAFRLSDLEVVDLTGGD
ncbi:hypothetical protein VTI74DRAFT_6867 [Chaetomium olivicolor]